MKAETAVPLSPLLFLFAILAGGCGADRSKWEIVLVNKGASPCSVNVAFGEPGSTSGASVDGVASGHTVPLVSGFGPTVVDSVKVNVGGKEKTLTPKLALPAGKRCTITVASDGGAVATVAE
jgi:hypothetical protein